jgi:hypothetical protein
MATSWIVCDSACVTRAYYRRSEPAPAAVLELGSFRSAPALASPFEISNQLREFVNLGIGHRQLEYRFKASQGLQIGLTFRSG